MERPAGEPARSGEAGCAAGRRLAAELQGIRTRTGKSLKELEQIVHASDSSISRYLSGRIVPPWPVIERLAHLAGDDPARLRPLWEHVASERHRQGTCEPWPAEQPREESRSEPPPAAPEAPSPATEPALAPRWPDRRAKRLVAILVGVTAVIFGGSGVLVGRWLAPGPRRVPVVQEVAACQNWPWPNGQPGQAALAPVQVHGSDHTATVQLVTRSIGGHELVWAQITHAHYGDRVWMDFSRNDGKTWTQCGPFTTTGATFASRAHEMAPSWKFRACGDTPRWPTNLPRDVCTAFW